MSLALAFFNAIIIHMSKPNFLIFSTQVCLRFFANILFFPLWWYSKGFVRFVARIINFWKNKQRQLGVAVWLKNIFVPMYGQHDFAGRIISFFIRLVQIIGRSFVLLFFVIIGIGLILFWLALPVLLIAASAYQLLLT